MTSISSCYVFMRNMKSLFCREAGPNHSVAIFNEYAKGMGKAMEVQDK